VFGRKTLEEKIAAMVRAEFAGIIVGLEREHREYLRRVRLKEETRVALENVEAKARELYSERIGLKKRFWEAYYEKDEAVLSKIESRSERLEHAAKRGEKAIEKVRADFERANFDEVAEGFALKTKANIAEDEVNRRIGALGKVLEDLLAEVRHDVMEAAQTLRDEYKEPRFDTDEARDAYVKKTIETLKSLAESYTPGG
jgi:hypothetical protein